MGCYSLPMVTIGHWNEQGIMFEEYLFWDNQEFIEGDRARPVVAGLPGGSRS